MTLAELFVAANNANVRLEVVDGQLQLRGPAISHELVAGAAEHKAVLLSLLPKEPAPSPSGSGREPEVSSALSRALQGNLIAGKVSQGQEQGKSWDARKADALVNHAISVKEAVGYSADAELRHRQFEASESIDDCWLARNMAGLVAAAEEFLKLLTSDPGLTRDGNFSKEIPIHRPECSGCEYCKPTGKEPKPPPGEHLSEVRHRIQNRERGP